jgi:transcription elongation GreA/GreB family factor
LVFKPVGERQEGGLNDTFGRRPARINAELARLRKRREHLLTGLVRDEDTVGNSGDAADEVQQAQDVAFVDKQIAKLDDLLHGSGSANTPMRLLPDGARVTLRLADGGVTTMRVISDVAEIPESQEAGHEDERRWRGAANRSSLDRPSRFVGSDGSKE